MMMWHWPVLVTILGPGPPPRLDPGGVGVAGPPAPLAAAPPTVCAGGGVPAARARPRPHRHRGAHRVMTGGLKVRGQPVRQVWNRQRYITLEWMKDFYDLLLCYYYLSASHEIQLFVFQKKLKEVQPQQQLRVFSIFSDKV